ncbi:MAG: hypothetical protein NC390_07110 [Fusobacterium sp.]|nr:hypothetical protein [Fusobacterium sp.]
MNETQNEKNIFSTDYRFSTRLNGYDVNMINDITETVDDEVIQLGVKINNIEDGLAELRDKISATERLGKLPDVIKLKIREKELERELSELKTVYAQKKSLSKPILKSKLKKRSDMPVIRAIQRFISRKILAKISKKFRSIMALSDSLEMLSGINKSVDELIEMKVPYGESMENYQKLTSYLYKANKIHSQIVKSMNK